MATRKRKSTTSRAKTKGASGRGSSGRRTRAASEPKTTGASARRAAGRARAAAPNPGRAAARRPGKIVAKAPAKRPARRHSGPSAAAAIFGEAVQRAMQGYGFDAIALFRDVIAADPKGELADDALFNIGAAYLQMRLVRDAEKAFTELLDRYPDATIDAVYNGNEHGRTAAKALLGRMQARYAAGDFDGAAADRAALGGYGDSWVTDPRGQRRTFGELAAAVMP